jgi:uncharacterized protein (DUF427 family)
VPSLIGELTVKTRLIHPAAAVLAAGLLLVSCSSSDSDSEDEDIQGVETGDSQDPDDDEPSEDPEPTPSDDGIDRPEIELPDDMNNVFEDTETGDPEQDAIIADVVQGINAQDMAISESDPSLEAVEFYYLADALIDVRTFIRGAADANDTWTGTSEYYDFTVETPHAGDAVVTYCIDTSEVQTRELDTGDVLPRDEDARNFNYTQAVLQESEQGVWQVSTLMPRDEELDMRCER